MFTDSQTTDGAFTDPVLHAQMVFRAVMEAMARPGTVQRVGELAGPPAPLQATAGAVALAMVDHDTPVWLDAALHASEAARSWLGFHTGAPVVALPGDAAFAIISEPGELIALDNFAQGSQEYPDRSATLVLAVATLAAGPNLLLEGPGIEKAAMLAPAPLPRHFTEQWKQNGARFPRGIDVILTATDAIACLPRTTRIRPLEG